MSKHSQKKDRDTYSVLVREYAGDVALTPAGLRYLGLVPMQGNSRVIPFRNAKAPAPKTILRAI
jgi:hypothetical protein